MRAVIQRVLSANVVVDSKIVGEIKEGLLVFIAVHEKDDISDAQWLATKLCGLRIFEDDAGKMNHSLLDIHGEILIVSQFTLYGSCEKGRRPSFTKSAKPEISIPLYEKFIDNVKAENVRKVATGIFGADMCVNIQNNGPVTLIVDTPRSDT